MSVIGPLLGVVVGALLTWFLTARSQRDDRRRDAWATWAEQAYRLMATRRELVERCWAEQSGSGAIARTIDELGLSFAQRVSRGLVREVERDAQLHSALARVLLAEPSSIHRDQARGLTQLLFDDVKLIKPDAVQHAFLRSHKNYLAALQATLDSLLGSYAEAGTPTQVLTWFKEKYDQLTSKDKPIKILYVDDDAPERGTGAA